MRTDGDWSYEVEGRHGYVQTSTVQDLSAGIAGGVYTLAAMDRAFLPVSGIEAVRMMDDNGRLMAASPDLLSALEEAVRWWNNQNAIESAPWIHVATAAIDKACGSRAKKRKD